MTSSKCPYDDTCRGHNPADIPPEGGHYDCVGPSGALAVLPDTIPDTERFDADLSAPSEAAQFDFCHPAFSDRDSLDLVREFHDAAGFATPDAPIGGASRHEAAELRFAAHNVELARKSLRLRCAEAPDSVHLQRARLIAEEFAELLTAMASGDVVEQLDALCDLRYVLDGTVLELGFLSVHDEAFLEVHRSNMAKAGPDGRLTRDPSGKVVKPAGWVGPDLASILRTRLERSDRGDE